MTDRLGFAVSDPDKFRRAGLINTIERQGHYVAAEGSSVDEVFSGQKGNRIDILLMRLHRGIHETRVFWAQTSVICAAIKIVGVVSPRCKLDLAWPITAGVDGLITTDADTVELFRALRLVSEGNKYMSAPIKWRVKKRFLEEASAEIIIGPWLFEVRNANSVADRIKEQLTERELQIFFLLKDDPTNRQMSLVLGVAESTVAFHLGNILEKLWLTSRVQAGTLALLVSSSISTGL